MNTLYLNRTATYRLISTTQFLLIIIAFTGCTTHKAINNISREKAMILRDSAHKYALAALNPRKSDLYYDSLFMSAYVKKQDYWNAGQTAAELGKYTKSIAIWSKMRKVKNDDEFDYTYWLPNMISPGYEYYDGLIHAKGFKKLWSHYPDYPLVHNLSNQDSALVKKIKVMYALDQRVRHRYIDSPSVRNNYLWTVCDSVNAISVDSIIVNRGVITTNEFGNFISRDFCILFDHLPKALLQQRMPLIEAAFKSHGISKLNYTLIKDRSLAFANKGQLYGTQIYLDTSIKKNVFYPIQRIKRIDKRRKKMGLGKLKFYAENHKVLLPKGYNP